MMTRSHALVVGGTGMMHGASLELARRGHIVSVVARRHSRMAALAADARALDAPGEINPLPVDYRDLNELAARIRAAQTAHGPIALAACWIHRDAPDTPAFIAELIASERSFCRYFQVLGGSPEGSPRDMHCPVAAIPGILYRRIHLGWIEEQHGSRWLTDDEISAGVIEAIDCDNPEHWVGTGEPWHTKPDWPD
jgi:hypothetical protein